MSGPAVNTADYLLDNGASDAVAVIEGTKTHTYRELSTAAARIAFHLQALDLEPGSRVAIVGPNSAFWIAAYLAILKLGLVVVPISATLTDEEADNDFAWAECSAVVVDRRSLRRSSAVFMSTTPVMTDDALADPRTAWPDTVADADSDAALMFTSGTTAHPKAARITHRNIQANTDSIIEYLQLTPSDRMLVVLPFFYCYGASLMHTHLRAGGSLVLVNSFVFPETALDALEAQSATGLAGVPSSYQMLLRNSTIASRPLPSLKRVLQAGGKMATAQVLELANAVPQAEVFVMYGQTEATARLSYLPPALIDDKPDSIGKGIPGVELQVVDSEDSPVLPGETGELVARGENIFAGYFRDEQASADKLRGGVLRTGDLATVDEDGFIYVLDRKDDFIKTWGYRVSSQEIEAKVLELTALVSAAAVGVPDPVAGESIELFVQVADGQEAGEAEILAHCRARMAKHMVPKSVSIMTGMPLTASGKIDKKVLRGVASTRSRTSH